MLDGSVTRDLMMEQVFVFYAEKGVRRSIEYVEIEFTFAISIQSLNIKSVILSPIFVNANIVSSPIKTATSLSGNNEISNKFVFNLNVLIKIFFNKKKRFITITSLFLTLNLN